MIRRALLAPGVETHGSDYDPKLVDWCRANIPNVQFSLNHLGPPLPYADDSFDFVYSRSVYTHLSADLQKQWLAEQLRVTRPGGLVLLTVHGDAAKHRLTVQERTTYEAVGIVEHRTADDGGPWFTTFNSPAYMQRNCWREWMSSATICFPKIHPASGKTCGWFASPA